MSPAAPRQFTLPGPQTPLNEEHYSARLIFRMTVLLVRVIHTAEFIPLKDRDFRGSNLPLRETVKDGLRCEGAAVNIRGLASGVLFEIDVL